MTTVVDASLVLAWPRVLGLGAGVVTADSAWRDLPGGPSVQVVGRD